MSRVFLVCLMICISNTSFSAPKSKLIPFWKQADANSQQRLDHQVWDLFLKKYGQVHSSGINRVRYHAVTSEDKSKLESYVDYLQSIRVRQLHREEQKAYWINLYNALTIHVMLKHWPVKSIMKVNISPGWFARGPWGAKLVLIEGQKLSLDNIEHGILRPIWKDPLIHYGVNCASLGCPNLALQAFTRENTQDLLKVGAKEYINHTRGVKILQGRLIVSSIYEWFKADFGGTDIGVITHLKQYANTELKKALRKSKSIYDDEYDWSINSAN